MKLWPRKAAEPQKPVVQTVDVPVIGEAILTTLYSVDVPTGRDLPIPPYANVYSCRAPRKETKVTNYLTCEQAHKEHPGLAVTQVKAIKVGGAYFHARLPAIEVQPKPKVSKGAKR